MRIKLAHKAREFRALHASRITVCVDPRASVWSAVYAAALFTHIGNALQFLRVPLLTVLGGELLSLLMIHSPGFLKVVDEAKSHVKELTIEQARERLARNRDAVLVDVREDAEWAKDHAAEAVHLGKGILERDIEQMFPNPDRELIMYCGGGFRSVLTAAAAQKMGYRNVYSLMGGYKGMVEAGWPMTSGTN